VSTPNGGTTTPGPRRAQGQTPSTSPSASPTGVIGQISSRAGAALLRARRLVHEDTSSDGSIMRRFTPQAEPSASVTFTNSLHPINQHPPGHLPATRPTAPDAKHPGKPVFSECHGVRGLITDTQFVPTADRANL
jgi:hypothetical protein